MNATKPLYIFDLDGTVRNLQHRLHHLSNLKDKHRWRRFEEACELDAPMPNVIHVLETLKRCGADIWFFTSCSTAVRMQTEQWLANHTTMTRKELSEALVMRDVGDYNPDDLLKLLWLQGMCYEDRQRLVCVFEDRDRVVAMWRKNGVVCLQVADGDF